MRRRMFSLLLVLCMVLGITAVTASAAEVTVPEGWYQVTVKVAPSAATVKFYSDSDATKEITENVYDDGIVDGYHQYTLVAPEGVYYYRAWEGNVSLGGMEFKVPIPDEYASNGTLMGKGQILTLRRLNFVTKSEHITKPEDYTVHLIPQDLHEAVNGTNYVNESGNVVCPIMINAAGNALTYNFVVDINGELANTYAIAPEQHLTFGIGKTSITRELAVNKVSWITITAPAAAKTQMFLQKNNYNVTELPVGRTETLSDGTVKSYFATPGGSSLTYRVSMDGKITRAGFTATPNTQTADRVYDFVVTFADYENPKTTASTGFRIENSSMLNINPQNNLKMKVGETFRLRSYRAGWQIISTDTANIMIEPDFHYNILSGAEHIDLVPVTDKCTGNAGSGMNGNWMDIKAVSEGTAIVEVSYDAIQIGGDTQYPGRFGAVHPSRKSIVVINVGGAQENSLVVTTTAETIAPQQPGDNGTYDWDADFDTVYFLEDSADFEFTAVMGDTVPDKMELSTDLGATWSEVSCNDGIYKATGLVAGNNILRATKDGKVEYQVVRAAKLGMTVTNVTRGGDAIIAGDKVKVHFSNIYTPIPKMSGIYNPGFNEVERTFYTLPEGVTASATSKQYGFATENQYTITFDSAGTKTLTNGYITGGVMGDPMGAHRTLVDSGRGVNFNASGFFFGRSILPDLTFEVIDMPTVEVTVVSDPEGAEITLTDASGNVIEANEDGTYSLNYATYSYKLTKEGYVPKRGEFTVGGDDKLTGKKTVTITMSAATGDIWDGTTMTEPKKYSDSGYMIATGPELAWFASNHNGASAIMTADVSLGGFGVSINSFAGTFDGNGHYITDFYGKTSLFSNPLQGAVIKNLGVVGEINSSNTVGGIAADGSNGSRNFTVENCVSRVEIIGGTASGGIVGGFAGETIKNCYNTGSVTLQGGSSYTGGIAGVNADDKSGTVRNCYNIGTVTDYSIVYPIMGTNRNNYALLGTAPNIGGTGLNADVLKTYASTLGDAYLDNPTSYNDGYPILAWEESRALAVAKVEFSAELEAYEDGEGFSNGAAAQLAQAVKVGKTSIAEATTLAEAQAALDQAKKTITEIDPESEIVVGGVSGDVNGDGTVNGKDSIMLLQYLTGQTNESFNAANADFNGDGTVNGKDSIMLLQYLVSNG